MISVVGMGPGSKEYLTGPGLRAVSRADVIFADDKWLAMFSDSPAEKHGIHPIDRFMARLNAVEGGKRVAILVSGDPGLFSLLNVIKREAPGTRLEVIPGISAPQVLFARLALDWSGVDFLSLHGRPIEALAALLRPGASLCVFTDGDNTPAKIGRAVLAQGRTGKAVVGANLTCEDEVVAEMTVEKLADYTSALPSIVYLEID